MAVGVSRYSKRRHRKYAPHLKPCESSSRCVVRTCISLSLAGESIYLLVRISACATGAVKSSRALYLCVRVRASCLVSACERACSRTFAVPNDGRCGQRDSSCFVTLTIRKSINHTKFACRRTTCRPSSLDQIKFRAKPESRRERE